MKISRYTVVFDAADLESESTFWANILGGKVEADDDWHTVVVNGAPAVAIQLAPDHVKPDWPDGQPQQVHLDLIVEDIKFARAEALELGARMLRPADDLDSADGFEVYADPAGHPFCLCWG